MLSNYSEYDNEYDLEPMPISEPIAPAVYVPREVVGAAGSGSKYEEGMIVKSTDPESGKISFRVLYKEGARSSYDGSLLYGAAPSEDEELVKIRGVDNPSDETYSEYRILREGMEVFFTDEVSPKMFQGETRPVGEYWERWGPEGTKYAQIGYEHDATQWRSSFVSDVSGSYNSPDSTIKVHLEWVSNPGTPEQSVQLVSIEVNASDVDKKLRWNDEFTGKQNLNVQADGEKKYVRFPMPEEKHWWNDRLDEMVTTETYQTKYYVDDKEASKAEYDAAETAFYAALDAYRAQVAELEQRRAAGPPKPVHNPATGKFEPAPPAPKLVTLEAPVRNCFETFDQVIDGTDALFPMGAKLFVNYHYKEKATVVDYSRTMTKLKVNPTNYEEEGRWFKNEELLEIEQEYK